MTYHAQGLMLHGGAHRKAPGKIGAPGLCWQVNYWIPPDPTQPAGGYRLPHPVQTKFKERRDTWIRHIDHFVTNMFDRITEIDRQFVDNLAERTPNVYGLRSAPGNQRVYLLKSTIGLTANGWTRRPIFEGTPDDGHPVAERNPVPMTFNFDRGIDLAEGQTPSRLQNITVRFIWNFLIVTMQVDLHSEYFSMRFLIELSAMRGVRDYTAADDHQHNAMRAKLVLAIRQLGEFCGNRLSNAEQGHGPNGESNLHNLFGQKHHELYHSVWDELKGAIITPSLALSTASGPVAGYFDGRIGLEFFDARGLLLFVPKGDDGAPIFSPALPSAVGSVRWYRAEDDRFWGDSEERKPTDHGAKASDITVACLPVIAGGFPDEHARVEYSATRFLGNRVIYVSSLAGESKVLEDHPVSIKFAILSKTHNRWQLGRFIDRIMLAGSVRVAAIMDLDILDEAGDRLREMERDVQKIMANLGNEPSLKASQRRLTRLTTKTASLGTTCDGGITYRIERSRYYVQQFESLLSDFRHDSVEGFQQYPVFVRRKLYSSSLLSGQSPNKFNWL